MGKFRILDPEIPKISRSNVKSFIVLLKLSKFFNVEFIFRWKKKETFQFKFNIKIWKITDISVLQSGRFNFSLLSLRLEGVETLKYRCVCRPPFGKFNIVSNAHGHMQKCDFCIPVCKTNFTDHQTPHIIMEYHTQF